MTERPYDDTKQEVVCKHKFSAKKYEPTIDENFMTYYTIKYRGVEAHKCLYCGVAHVGSPDGWQKTFEQCKEMG